MTGLDTLLKMIEQYVAYCCSVETPPRVSELAQLVGLSACTLVRHFRREHPLTLADVLKETQLAHAMEMLESSDLPTTKVAYSCGYGTRRTFFRAFQRATGMTPAEYRDMARRS
jgi:transcriptional regulator GlxA family with amidase domain